MSIKLEGSILYYSGMFLNTDSLECLAYQRLNVSASVVAASHQLVFLVAFFVNVEVCFIEVLVSHLYTGTPR